MGARCRAKHAQLLTESEISLTWALACGVDPASCELRAASCKLQSHKKVEPRTCGVHPASCELQAASLRAAEKSSLGPVQNDAWQQLQCVGGGLPSLLGSGAEERGQAIEVAPCAAKRRGRSWPRRGGIEWVRQAAHTRPTIDQYT